MGIGQLTILPEQGRDDNAPRPCPFCGSTARLDFQFRQAQNHKTRHGRYDASIYCRRCYCFGPRIRSEDVSLPPVSGSESPRIAFSNAMRVYAIQAWNRRVDESQLTIGGD